MSQRLLHIVATQHGGVDRGFTIQPSRVAAASARRIRLAKATIAAGQRSASGHLLTQACDSYSESARAGVSGSFVFIGSVPP